jgi:CsoR family transcriptional regulator, copper-sensing transcriptional repressor
LLAETKGDATRRLSYIEGHIAGVKRMVEEERYCVDVLKQTHAIKRAIDKLETILLEGHLHTCVIEGVKNGREEEVLQELVDLYAVKNIER